MLRPIQAVGLAVVLVSCLTGCGVDKERERLMKEQYPTYPEQIRLAIDGTYLVQGMTQEQVYLALGKPHCKTTTWYREQKVDAWMYPPDQGSPCTQSANQVYFDKGLVIGWAFKALGY